jgi:hypothetical protein
MVMTEGAVFSLLPFPRSLALTEAGLLLPLASSVCSPTALSHVLVLYLKALGLTEGQIGLLLTMTLLGDTVISCDHDGNRSHRTEPFASAWQLLPAGSVATIGVLSPQEVGPFLSIEQAALSQTVSDDRPPFSPEITAPSAPRGGVGALVGGFICRAPAGKTGADVYRPVVMGYCLSDLLAVGSQD